MAELSILAETRGPWILRTLGSCEDLVAQIKRCIAVDKHVVVLEGNKMFDPAGFYNELIEKLKLPEYFGHNLNALDECLTDLEWLERHTLIVIIQDAEVILKGHRELFEGFVDVLLNAGEEWSNTVLEGEDWDRSAVAFHVVFDYRNYESFETHEFEQLELVPRKDAN